MLEPAFSLCKCANGKPCRRVPMSLERRQSKIKHPRGKRSCRKQKNGVMWRRVLFNGSQFGAPLGDSAADGRRTRRTEGGTGRNHRFPSTSNASEPALIAHRESGPQHKSDTNNSIGVPALFYPSLSLSSRVSESVLLSDFYDRRVRATSPDGKGWAARDCR